MKKESIYNFSANININGKPLYLIYNTLSHKLVDFTDQSFSSLTDTQERIMEDNGFLIDENINETQLAQYYRLTTIFDKKLLALTIIPTADCNFRCIYCYQNSKKSYIDNNTVEKIISFLERNVQFYSAVSITWFGGEPLLCKKEVLYITEKANAICKRNKTAFVSYMTTNGYELDLDFFKSALSSGLRYYQITIDGNREIHNAQRPHKNNNNSYDKIVSNLTAISENISRTRFEIGIRINVSSESLTTMPEFIDTLANLFASDKRFVIIWQWVRNWGGDRINKDLVMSNTPCSDLTRLSIKKGLRCYEGLSCNSGTDICEATYKSGFVINYSGKVYKCSMRTFENPEDDINQIGYLDANGKLKIDIQKEAMWLLPKIDEKCYDCVFFPQCLGNSCPFTSIYMNKRTCINHKKLIPVQMESMYLSGRYITI